MSIDVREARRSLPERLHEQVLDLVRRQPRLLCDGLERHRPVVRIALEHRLDQRHEADLLPQERLVLGQDRLGGEIGDERLERANRARVEGVEQR